MFGRIRKIYEPYLVRPMVYMTFTRFILALAITLLADHFISPKAGRPVRADAFFLCAALFALFAWIAWLRLDGMQLPKFMMLRLDPAKKPSSMYGDMIDHVDERPGISFSELAEEEKDLCILAADVFCFLAFLIIALFL